ncbi:MAG: hypothetical protein ACRD5H_07285 [Nitrososphaerales archaeon]
MKLEQATKLAEDLKNYFQPISHRIEIAGSIRRKMAEVNDIDIVLIPDDWTDFELSVNSILKNVTLNGKKIKRGLYKDVIVDLYIADKDTFDTLLFIRTGSAEHNIRLTTLAKKKGWKLHASGLGLTNEKNEIIARTETEIFDKLVIPYLPPEERGFENAALLKEKKA